MTARRCANWPMPRFPHEPDDTAAEDRDHSLQRAVLRCAALLAERLLCRAADAMAVRRRCRRSRARAVLQGPRRWRRRRGALARPDHADRGSHEARRRPAAAPAHDGGDGAAGLRPVRLQLPRLFGRDREQGGAASQSLRPRRQGNRPDAEGAERGTGKGAGGLIRPGRGACRGSARGRGGARPFARQSGRGQLPVAPSAQQGADRKRKPGISISTSPAAGLDYVVGDSFGIFARNDLGHVDQIIALLGASHTTKVRGKTLREVLLDDVSLAPAPDPPVRTVLLHHRRRAAREGARAGAGRGSRRRCRDARRDGGAAEIFRRASASRSLRRGAGAAAAAALFDLVVAQCDARQTVADGRLRALRDRQAQAPRPCLDLPGRTHQSRRRGQGLCAEGARLRAAAGSEGADHHDRAGHRHRTVPRLPARPQGDRRARQELAVLRPSAQRIAISSMPTN